MPSVSVAIIALNEEERIRACLESVAWAEEIVVVDSGSSDKTVAIAREFTDRVVFHAWEGYGAQKNFALEQCRSEWILSLDADERVSEALHAEIVRTLAAPAHAGYLVARQNFFQGAWVRHGGWYPRPPALPLPPGRRVLHGQRGPRVGSRRRLRRPSPGRARPPELPRHRGLRRAGQSLLGAGGPRAGRHRSRRWPGRPPAPAGLAVR